MKIKCSSIAAALLFISTALSPTVWAATASIESMGASFELAGQDRSANPPANPPGEKEWTFITFLNGHNSLDRAGYMNVSEMEKVGSTDQVNVVVQWASTQALKTKRIYVRQGAYDTIEELDRVDMGNAQNLVEFVNWAIEHYPAKHYFIDVWNHGSGWHFTGNSSSLKVKFKPLDISYDDLSGHSITTEDLGRAIRSIAQTLGRKIDVYGSDACQMGMAEVMGELKDSVEVFVGSEELEPNDGWPYGDLLQRWNALPNASARDVGKILTEEYLKAYTGGVYGHDDATLSAIDLNQFDAFTSDFKSFSDALKKLDPTKISQITKVAAKTQSFSANDYRDLGDFLQRLKAPALALNLTEINQLDSRLSQIVIGNGITSKYKKAKGLAFWLPTSSYSWSQYSKRYQGLIFDQATNWSDFLSRFYDKN